MSPEERQAYVRRLVAAAPPLTATQAATIRGTLLSGVESDELSGTRHRRSPRPREKGGGSATNGAPPSLRSDMEGADGRTVAGATDIDSETRAGNDRRRVA